MSAPTSPLQHWHIYTALALLSYQANATPLTILFAFMAGIALLIRINST